MSALLEKDPIERFREIIERRLGLAFEDSRLSALHEVLGRRLGETALDAPTYMEQLTSSRWSDELPILARELTVGETYFFRHFQQFEALRSILLADRERWLRAPPSILSAGCASGEEPLSLAMLLRDILPECDPAILGVDINRASLDRCREGRFSAWSLRETPEAAKRRWFRPIGQSYSLDPSILRAVRLREANLAVDDAEAFGRGAYDIIFCRNVLMYFGPDRCRDAVSRLRDALVPGGYLFLGSAETLRGLSHDFHLCHAGGAFFYQRKGGVPAPNRVEAAPPAVPPTATSSPLDGAELQADSAGWVESIAKAAERVRVLSSRDAVPLGTNDWGRGREEPARELRKHSVTAGNKPRLDLSVPLDLLHKEQFSSALASVRQLPPQMSGDPEVLLLEAILLASADELGEAELVCQRLLESDELNAGAHYVLALCSAGSGRIDKALYHDRIAAYLDPHFAMPRLHLGLLLRRAGHLALARAELETARSLLEHEDAARISLFGGGFGRAALLELCGAELAASEAGR